MQEEISYLSNAIAIIRQNFTPDDSDGSMTAAKIGFILRRQIGPPGTGGFVKLKDVLTELEQRQLIRTGGNSKGAFAIWIQDGNDREPNRTADPIQTSTGQSRRLQQPIWYAFVAELIDGERYFNCRTGQVLLAQKEAPAEADDWVRIEPIASETEKDDARQFLGSLGVDVNEPISKALDLKTWFVELPRVLDRDVAFKWKRYRTGRVVEHVEKWRQANGIDQRLVYHIGTASRRSCTTKKPEQLRIMLLASIARMSTDELLSLRIPTRHLVAEIQPDLLSR